MIIFPLKCEKISDNRIILPNLFYQKILKGKQNTFNKNVVDFCQSILLDSIIILFFMNAKLIDWLKLIHIFLLADRFNWNGNIYNWCNKAMNES